MSEPRFRYASTLGEQYAVPIYFETPEDAIRHASKARKLLKGLSGVGSMRVEALSSDGEWLQLWPESAVRVEEQR